MPELDVETRAEIAKLCHAASSIALRLATLPPDLSNELSTVLNIGINRVRLHFGLPTGWSPAAEWAIIAAHGDITSGGNQDMVEPVPPSEAPDASAAHGTKARRRLFR